MESRATGDEEDPSRTAVAAAVTAMAPPPRIGGSSADRIHEGMASRRNQRERMACANCP